MEYVEGKKRACRGDEGPNVAMTTGGDPTGMEVGTGGKVCAQVIDMQPRGSQGRVCGEEVCLWGSHWGNAGDDR